MEEKKLLSVIVPVYNVEGFLPVCIESILRQTYRNIQIILVDDGSVDSSGAICDDYQKKDPRIRVIHKQNEGPILARQTGVLAADGAYVTFVDSDDWIEADMYEILMKVAENAEVVISGICRFFDQDCMITDLPLSEAGFYNREKIEKEIIPYMLFSARRGRNELDPSLCTKIFRKEKLIRHFKEMSGLDIHYGEDAALIYPLILETDSLAVLRNCFYYHRQRAQAAEMTYPYIKDVNFFHRLYALFAYLQKKFSESEFKEQLLLQLDHFYMRSVGLKQKYYADYKESEPDVFPFWSIEKGAKIALYGAGNLGKQYFAQNQKYQFAEIVLWADQNYDRPEMQKDQIVSPEELCHAEFAYVLIAVKNIETASEIRKDLIKKGIAEEKIIWNLAKVIEI